MERSTWSGATWTLNIKVFNSQMDDLEKQFQKMSLVSLLGDIEEHMEWTHISKNMGSNRVDCNENLKRKAVSQSGRNKKKRKIMISLEEKILEYNVPIQYVR